MAHVINTNKHLCLSLHSLPKMKMKNWPEVSKKADGRISKPPGTQTFINCINAGSEIRKRTDRHKFTCKIMLWVNAWQCGNYCRNSTLILFQTSQVYLMSS